MAADAPHAPPAAGPAEERFVRSPPLTVSVVISAYALERWETLVRAVASVQRQTLAPSETIVVIDHNDELLERALNNLNCATVVPNRGAPGLSAARNTGVEIARAEIVAFIDDDACAHPSWLAELLAPYRDPDVVGTGGAVTPRWQDGRRGAWLPEEFYWTIGCSYRGQASELVAIRNPIGANMSFRRAAVLQAGGFPVGLGRTAALPLGCEETELAVRVTQARATARIMYAPAARVDHTIDPERVRLRYFLARCWAEGRSKATVVAHVGHRAGLASERTYLRHALPGAVAHYLRDAIAGDRTGLQRAAATLVGATVTMSGYGFARAFGADLTLHGDPP